MKLAAVGMPDRRSCEGAGLRRGRHMTVSYALKKAV